MANRLADWTHRQQRKMALADDVIHKDDRVFSKNGTDVTEIYRKYYRKAEIEGNLAERTLVYGVSASVGLGITGAAADKWGLDLAAIMIASSTAVTVTGLTVAEFVQRSNVLKKIMRQN